MHQIIIKHNGYTIRLWQDDHSFHHDVRTEDGHIVFSGNVYIGDPEKIDSRCEEIKRITGLDVEVA